MRDAFYVDVHLSVCLKLDSVTKDSFYAKEAFQSGQISFLKITKAQINR